MNLKQEDMVGVGVDGGYCDSDEVVATVLYCHELESYQSCFIICYLSLPFSFISVGVNQIYIMSQTCMFQSRKHSLRVFLTSVLTVLFKESIKRNYALKI